MADPNLYRWKFNFRARQFFNAVNPGPVRAPLTNDQIDTYVRQLDLVARDIVDGARANRVEQRINDLKAGLLVPGRVRDLPPIPAAVGTDADLNAIYPAANMPTAAQIAAARLRLVPAPVAAAPRAPAAPAVSVRPDGIPPPAPPAQVEPTDNIVLAANPRPLYEAIRDEGIRILTRELSDPNYNPEQTFLVAIGDPAGAGAPAVPDAPSVLPVADGTYPINLELTPIQYAALKALKGTVRYILNNSTSDLTKKINGKSLKDAVLLYRKSDAHKDEIRYMFDVIDKAVRDATDDFTSGVPLDSKYGDGANIDLNKKLAKKYYTDEYNDLKTPKPLSPTAPKPTGTLISEAKAKGKQDGEVGSPRDTSYDVKPRDEKEAYGKAYDKALATYYGERDAKLNESSDIGKLASQFSTHYSEPTHQTEVERIYKDAHEKNRSKTSDLVKEAGYVGTYPPSDAVLSGNFFGFGSELSKIVGFDTSGAKPKTDTDAQYKEGLVKFVENIQSIIGQAKYAGYTDGRKKNAKYTTPGKITVAGKDYAIDFGKLNTRVTDLPDVSPGGVLQETAESGEAARILTELRRFRDSAADADSLPAMVTYLRTQSTDNPNAKIKQILKSIVVAQKGGFDEDQRAELTQRINTLRTELHKTFLREKLLTLRIGDDTLFGMLSRMTDRFLEQERAGQGNVVPAAELEAEVQQNVAEQQRPADDAPIAEEQQEQEDSDPPKQTISAKNIDGIKLRIAKLKNGTIKQALQDRVVPTLTAQEYRALDIEVAKAYNREVGLRTTIKTLDDPDIKQSLLNEYDAVRDEVALATLEKKVKYELQRIQLAIKIQTLKDKKDFEARFRNPGQNMDNLKQLVDDQYNLENPGIGEQLQSGISKTKFAVQDVSSAVGTAASAVGKSIVTGLGNVTTKSQLYSVVQQAFSVIPKYITKKLDDIPRGVSPDDPSLEDNVHPIKRVQAMYDKEYERGYKEAVRPVGGTRRKTKKSSRITKKKQASKK